MICRPLWLHQATGSVAEGVHHVGSFSMVAICVDLLLAWMLDGEQGIKCGNALGFYAIHSQDQDGDWALFVCYSCFICWLLGWKACHFGDV